MRSPDAVPERPDHWPPVPRRDRVPGRVPAADQVEVRERPGPVALGDVVGGLSGPLVLVRLGLGQGPVAREPSRAGRPKRHPLLLDGQIEGGILQGVGYALTEELLMHEGRILNPNFHNYKMLTAADIPNIHFFPIETNDKEGPYGAKGAGEAPLIPTAAAITNAVCNALGVEFIELPLTPERILKAISLNKTNSNINSKFHTL